MFIVTFFETGGRSGGAGRRSDGRSSVSRETLTSLAARKALTGRTAIVTGASGAFGSATLSVLKYLGADAGGLDRVPGDDVLACDVRDDEQVEAAVGAAVGRLGGRLDVLIHYAGVGASVDVGRALDADVREPFDVNLLGPWRVTAAAIPSLLSGSSPGRQGGRPG